MSYEHAEEFHKRMSSDEGMRDEVTAASQEVIEIAKARGLHFDRDELAKVLANKWQDGGEDPEGADPATSIISERPGV